MPKETVSEPPPRTMVNKSGWQIKKKKKIEETVVGAQEQDGNSVDGSKVQHKLMAVYHSLARATTTTSVDQALLSTANVIFQTIYCGKST